MEITNCTKADFDQILINIAKFWGDERTLQLHHPMFINEFGETAFVIKEADQVIAYLFGFIAQNSPTGYIHLVAVHNNYKQHGLARKLYQYFGDYAVQAGCQQLKAITTPTNTHSIAFHQSLGFSPIGHDIEYGLPIVKDYSGPGLHRVVLIKSII